MSIAHKLGNLDRRIIYVFIFLSVIWPLLSPIGLPIEVLPYTTGLYDAIEELPAGSTVVMSYTWGQTELPWAKSPTKAVTTHLLSRDINVIFLTYGVTGPWAIEYTFANVPLISEKEYGVDYVNLGFIAGGEMAYAAVANDMWEAVAGRDYYQTELEDIPLMTNIHDAGDVDLVITVTGGGDNPAGHLRQWQVPFGTPVAIIVYGVLFPANVPYFPEQILGIINGIRGGAEYEALIGAPSAGTSWMDAISAAHIVMAFFIILGNVAYILEKMEKR